MKKQLKNYILEIGLYINLWGLTKLPRTIFWYVCGCFYTLITTPLLVIVKILGAVKMFHAHDRLATSFTSKAARVLIHLSGSKVIITGAENIPQEGPVVFVSNHQGHMDSAVLLGFIKKPKGFVSIVEAKRFPIIYSWMKSIKCVFMDRSNIKQSVECINKAVEIVKQGHSMVIFPEGKLSDSDEMAEFKKGSMKLAVKAGVPIIPVTISGTYKMMNKSGRNIRPCTIMCIIDKSIQTANLSKDEEQELAQKVRSIIENNLNILLRNEKYENCNIH